MNRKIVGIVVNMGIVLAATVGAARAQNSSGSAGIDAVLRGAVERNDVPGVVALVTDRRRVLYLGVFGVADVSSGRALTADALFRIASMTKAITSTAAMQLIEQGRFGLDDPVDARVTGDQPSTGRRPPSKLRICWASLRALRD
jgi:methyl acetate hydrolase